MNFLTDKLKQTRKAFAHYWNPNQNPTDKDKKALQLLDRAQVDYFISFMNQNLDININVVDYNKASLLIKAQDVANNTNQYKKLQPEQQLKQKAIKAVNYLLQRGVDINYRDKNGITALLSACHWGNNDVAQLLMKNGADVNLASNTNNFYTNPLLSAYFKKNIPLVILLISYNANVEQAIQLAEKGNGFKLNQDDLNFLRSIGNISTLIKTRKQQQHENKNTLLTGMSDMVFEEFCFNI